MANLIEQLRSGDVVLTRVYDELTKARDVVFSFAPGDLHEMINGARHGLGALPRFEEAAVRIENLEAALAVETRANVAMNHRMETLIDARNATIARANRYEAALRAIANHPTGGVGCNPEQFVEAAKAALGGA